MGNRSAALDVVTFVAGGFRFGVEASKVSVMSSNANQGSIQAEDLIGLPLASPAQRRWLRTRVQGKTLEVSEPVEIRQFTAAQIFALPQLVATRITLKNVRAVALDQDGIILLLDLERDTSSFNNSLLTPDTGIAGRIDAELGC